MAGRVRRITHGKRTSLYEVPSLSRPGITYVVTEDRCTCMGFVRFYEWHRRHGLPPYCSHLEAVRIHLGKEPAKWRVRRYQAKPRSHPIMERMKSIE